MFKLVVFSVLFISITGQPGGHLAFNQEVLAKGDFAVAR